MRKAAIAVFALLVLIAAMLLVVRSVQSRYMVIRAYTDDAGGLEEGTSVRLNGIPIGYLDKLNLTTSRDPKRKIAFVLKVRRRFVGDIPRDSLINVAATNLLGNYFLDIIQGHSSEPVADGGELQTSTSTDPNKLLAQMGNELQEITAIFDRFGNLVAAVPKGQGNIGKWETQGINRFDEISKEYLEFRQSVGNSPGSLSKAGELSAQVDGAGKRLDDLLAGVQNGQGSAGQFGKLSADLHDLRAETDKLTTTLDSDEGPSARLQKLQGRFDELAQKIQGMSDRIDSGVGTLGQFPVNPTLSNALAQTGAEFQALVKGLQQNPRKFISLKIF